MEYSEKLMGSVFENMINGFAYHKIILDDQKQPIDYVFLDINSAFETFTGLLKENIIGKSIKEVAPDIVQDRFDWIKAYGNVALNDKSIIMEQYSEALGKWFLINAFSPSYGYFITVFVDITEIKMRTETLSSKNEELGQLYAEINSSEEELRIHMDLLREVNHDLKTTQQREERAGKMAKVGSWELDLSTYHFTPSANSCYMIGIDPVPSLNRKSFRELVFPEDHAILDAALENLVTYDIPYDTHFRLRRADNGEIVYFHVIAEKTYDPFGKLVKVTGAFQDITEIMLYEKDLQAKNEELAALYQEILSSEEELRQQFHELIRHKELLERMGYHDALTDLPNRTLFFEKLEIAIDGSKEKQTQVAVMFLDMDNFKRVNDTLGHNAGDQLLIEIAHRIRSCIREQDTVARMSGDEFLILLPSIHENDEVLALIHKIQSLCKQPYQLSGASVDITTSIGITMYPQDGETPLELLKHADTAMYKAKDEGKNTYRFFNYAMKEEMIQKIEFEKLLKKAVTNKEFVLHYQPQFRAEGLELRGFEALIRWNSPEMGFVSPLTFIGIAEETGIIVEIGEWVLQEACRFIKQIQVHYGLDLTISVNISLVQLRQKGFDQIILNYLHKYEIKPSNLELEVTESLLIESWDVAIDVLNKLKEVGVRVALDDFGTGYSSLSYLKKIPIHLLKIDKAFVDEIDYDNPQGDLTESIISLVHKLGIETIAEGVETLEQLNYLTQVNCDNFQGYYLGRPMPQREAIEIIKKHYNKHPRSKKNE